MLRRLGSEPSVEEELDHLPQTVVAGGLDDRFPFDRVHPAGEAGEQGCRCRCRCRCRARRRLLRPFQNENATGFENVANSSLVGGDQFSTYRGVAVHNVRQALALEDVVDELGEIEQITLGAPTPIVIGGFDGQRIEAEVTDRVTLWSCPPLA